MSPFPLFDPVRLSVEIAYTLIVVILCFTIYYKTRELYDLTKHEGISHFRITFLFFGLAYISRFILFLTVLMGITFDIHFPRNIFAVFPLVFSGYFSTMAILSLSYSILWKKIQVKHTFLLFNVIAVLISGVAFISRSPFLLTLAQAVLLIFTAMIIVYYIIRKSGKISQLYILYFLFFIFWIVNLFTLGPRRLIPFEIQTVFQILSIFVIGIIYYKVGKWTR